MGFMSGFCSLLGYANLRSNGVFANETNEDIIFLLQVSTQTGAPIDLYYSK